MQRIRSNLSILGRTTLGNTGCVAVDVDGDLPYLALSQQCKYQQSKYPSKITRVKSVLHPIALFQDITPSVVDFDSRFPFRTLLN